MNKYNYKVFFKKDGQLNYRYYTVFMVEAENNQSAKTIGEKRWKEFLVRNKHLKAGYVVKTICRKVETKPRQQKRTSLQKALDALNQYIVEELE